MAIPPLGVFRELWETVATEQQATVPALPESALPFFLARLPTPASGRPVVVVLLERASLTLPGISRALQFWRTMELEGDPRPAPIPPVTLLPLLLPQERSGDIPTPRLRAFWQALMALREGTPRMILTTPRELNQPAPKSGSDLGALSLTEQQTLSPTLLAERLVGFGYVEERAADEPGTFARRGGIVDVHPFNTDGAIRIEFSGNTIERIRATSGRNGGTATDTDALLKRVAETGPRTWAIYPLGLPTSLPTTVGRIIDHAYIVAEEGTLPPKVGADLLFHPFSPSSRLREAPAYGGQTERLAKDVKRALAQKRRVIILTARPEALRETMPTDKQVQIVPADTAADARGFLSAEESVHILTDADIGESGEEAPLTWDTGMAYARRLTPGEYAVHRDHGIGRFRGIERRELHDAARDYLVLEYAAGDKLFVPVEVAYKVTAYIGAANPVIHRLGGSEWDATTKHVREETAGLAKDLLALYAAREVESGTAYPPDTDADRKLAGSFPYEVTPDQASAIREVTQDMERAQPMDRLVCGDVGFGKTEVAIRAAFKAVNFGRQAAVLAPTTLLAQQHYDTFRERLKDFPATIAILSRFQSPAEQEAVIRKLAAGDVHIVIGTHRLLSDDVRLKALGILIIDEEQKFGVEQKEQLRKLRASVDVLSLSATPIPRTLHMALSGLRQLSVIATPPGGRRPVITKVAREQDDIVKKALELELGRKGQAYVLWNRVETIEAAAERIRKLAPHARIVVGHGQMPEDELMRVMEQFDTRQADILVCSTIIQNGIDLPNVNTLIVFDAPSFGLSDLYQLRGRVGRGNQQAYAYFLYRQGRLPFEARKRLSALLEAVELGSGWTLALRDLEIRGAGNLLGKEQHGTIRAVGVHLFGELLGEEVERLRTGEAPQEITDVQIDLPIKAFLPETYIPNLQERLAAYTRVGSVRTTKDIAAARKDLEARYGDFPPEAEMFFRLVNLKFLSMKADVAGIAAADAPSSPKEGPAGKEKRLTITFREGLTPTLAYAAIADNPRWTFTGQSMSMPFSDLGPEFMTAIEHALNVLVDARQKERLGGRAAQKKKKEGTA
jgi:transcription-repair coupling factor (superfamily II helicase)